MSSLSIKDAFYFDSFFRSSLPLCSIPIILASLACLHLFLFLIQQLPFNQFWLRASEGILYIVAVSVTILPIRVLLIVLSLSYGNIRSGPNISVAPIMQTAFPSRMIFIYPDTIQYIYLLVLSFKVYVSLIVEPIFKVSSSISKAIFNITRLYK